ncbi:MAG: hypothetical protein AAFQ22_07740 [Pseudomonadota bacterium]
MHSPTPAHDDARIDAQPHEAARSDTPTSDVAPANRANPHADAPDLSAEFNAEPDNNPDELARSDAQLRVDGYTLTVDQVMQRLDVEGVAKSRRTVQQYMKDGQIDSRRVQVGSTIRRLANELDMARFIEELKRREALALLARGENDVDRMTEQRSATVQPEDSTPGPNIEQARLQERVDQLELRLADSQAQSADLREQLKAANAQVNHWAENARDLKQLLSAQAEMNAPVLAALAKNLDAQAGKAREHNTPPLELH